MDDFIYLLEKADDWVANHLPYFYKTKKSELEYYQMNLYGEGTGPIFLQKSIDFYSSIYGSVDLLLTSSEVYYRKIEYLALLSLQYPSNSEEYKSQIKQLHTQGFLNSLIRNQIPLDILCSREHLYVITHDIFYTSIF